MKKDAVTVKLETSEGDAVRLQWPVPALWIVQPLNFLLM